jgi:hypothetical protein
VRTTHYAMSVNTAPNAWYKMPQVKELQRIKMGIHPSLVLVQVRIISAFVKILVKMFPSPRQENFACFQGKRPFPWVVRVWGAKFLGWGLAVDPTPCTVLPIELEALEQNGILRLCALCKPVTVNARFHEPPLLTSFNRIAKQRHLRSNP